MSRRARKRIFDIPELVKFIYNYLDIRDASCLAQSSPQLFDGIMPLLWERVEGPISQLFALLPPPKSTKTSKVPSQSLTEEGFSRFNLYAPWIKHLELIPDDEYGSQVEEIRVLYDSLAMRVLLPNLRSITSSTEDIFWILPFLSPHLLRLEFKITSMINPPQLPIRDSAILLHLLPEKCPKLQTLVILPDQDTEPTKPALPAAEYLKTSIKPEAFNQFKLGLGPFLSSLIPLVNLTTSDEILNPTCFETIRAWPLLESLAIFMDPNKNDYTLPEVASTAFPSLKTLALYWLPDFETFTMFWSVPTLVKKLTSVKLLPSGDFCCSEDSFSDLLKRILSVLVEQSPLIQDLWLRALHPDAIRPVYRIPLSTLDILQKIPLQALYIEGVCFTEYAKAVQPLATTFSTLKELGFPNYEVSFSDLRVFDFKMPNLESLRFDIDLRPLPTALEVNLVNNARHRRSRFHTIEANFFGLSDQIRAEDVTSFKCKDAISLAQYLFSMWPNVQIVAQVDEDSESMPEDYETHRKMIKLINDHLAALSCCNRDPSISYEDINILNQGSWNKCFTSA